MTWQLASRMNPEPTPRPLRMNTVELRAVSIALRAGKDLASWASRPSRTRGGSALRAKRRDAAESAPYDAPASPTFVAAASPAEALAAAECVEVAIREGEA